MTPELGGTRSTWGRFALGRGRSRGDEEWPRRSTGPSRTPTIANSPWILRYPQVWSPSPDAGRSRRCRREWSVVPGGGDRSTGAERGPDASGASVSGWTKNLRTVPAVNESTQPGKQRPITWPQRRTGHLAAEHGHFVSEHDDLNREFAVVRATETKELDEPNER